MKSKFLLTFAAGLLLSGGVYLIQPDSKPEEEAKTLVVKLQSQLSQSQTELAQWKAQHPVEATPPMALEDAAKAQV